jgi:hypothetical protein
MNVSKKSNKIAQDMLLCGKRHALIWDSMNKKLTTLKKTKNKIKSKCFLPSNFIGFQLVPTNLSKFIPMTKI